MLTFKLCLIKSLSERLAVAFAILFLDELFLGRGWLFGASTAV